MQFCIRRAKEYFFFCFLSVFGEVNEVVPGELDDTQLLSLYTITETEALTYNRYDEYDVIVKNCQGYVRSVRGRIGLDKKADDVIKQSQVMEVAGTVCPGYCCATAVASAAPLPLVPVPVGAMTSEWLTGLTSSSHSR